MSGTFIEAFAGVGGFGLGLERCGWRCVGQVEIGKFQQRVLARHWPDVPRWGDIRDFGHAALAHAAGVQQPIRLDLLAGGFPCQDLSVAGRRAGLAGARSGLFWEFVRVARELQPAWLLLENVPGLLSSNRGEDFGVVIDALGELGYGVAWRVLDARHFGVPQRRRRVFIVGRLGAPVPHEVLFEPEGGDGHLAASAEAGEGTADEVGVGVAHSLRGQPNKSNREDSDTYIPLVGATLKANTGRNHVEQDYIPMMSPALRQRGYSGFDASEDGTGRGTPLISVTNDSTPVTMEDEIGALKIGSGLGIPSAPWIMRMREGKAGGGKGPLIRDDESLTLATANDQTLFAANVRRLTPTECERLMGWEPGHTCLCGVEPYSTEACKCPDGPRYAAIGNGVVANVVEWIGRRIVEAELRRAR